MARGLAAAFLVVALLAACVQTGSPPVAVHGLPSAPNPLSVTVNPDLKRASKAFIPSTGGTISAVSADGSTFSLQVPDGALLSGESITMTPIATIGGLPFSGGMLASVDLAPAGLSFIKAATLTIKPSRRPARGMIVFEYAKDGKELHEVPFDEAAGVIRIDVYHFSGEGAGDGTPAEATDTASKYPPSSGEAQAFARLAAASADCRARSCDADKDPAYRKVVEQAIADWFSGSVGPGLKAAENDDSLLGAALADWIAWQLVAIRNAVTEKFSRLDDAAKASAIKGLQNALEQASQRCAKNYATTEIQNMFLWGGIANKLGFGQAPGLDQASLDERIGKCATFELKFDSTIVLRTTKGDVTARRTASVPLVPDVQLMAWKGSGQLNGELSWPPVPHCSVSIRSIPSTLTVPFATPGINLGFRALEMVVAIRTGEPTSIVTISCPYSTTTLPGDEHWLAGWSQLHYRELDRVSGMGYVIRNWELTGDAGPIVATKVYKDTFSSLFETTTLTFVHAPRT